ncbi:MAG: hypothetical protein ABJA78_13450, partial [Ferruginibacter sp.]
MKKIFIFCLSGILFCSNSFAQQNVGIGTNTPNSSAILDVSSTSKGILVPRMTSSQRTTSIVAPATGLMVFDTDSACFVYYDGAAWNFVRGKNNVANDWSVGGNTGTNPNINFIGTTDNKALRFKSNNTIAGEVGDTTLNTLFGLYGPIPMKGKGNAVLGYFSLTGNTTGSYNAAVGINAMYFNTTGNYNTAIGRAALFSNADGVHNTAAGDEALANSNSGYSNTGIGTHALYSNQAGSNLVALGDSALYSSNIINGQNTAIGSKALF